MTKFVVGLAVVLPIVIVAAIFVFLRSSRNARGQVQRGGSVSRPKGVLQKNSLGGTGPAP